MIIATEEVNEANKVKLENKIQRIKAVMKDSESKEDKEYHIKRIRELKQRNKLKNAM